KNDECTNLLTPTCISSSYVAYGAIRILPTFMILGQSAGLAASIAIDREIPIQDVEYSELRTGLLQSGQILDIPDNWLDIITTNN
ncbi:MAG: FAD-dependent oxidoreductase, partial [Cyclobacteriaceae bacterium]